MQGIILLTTNEIAALIRDIFAIVFLAFGTVALVIGLIYGLPILQKLSRVTDRLDKATESAGSILSLVRAFGSSIGGSIIGTGEGGGLVRRIFRRLGGGPSGRAE